ncbi:hypothetical protein AAY473_011861 [Plecturocebus cupreus]
MKCTPAILRLWSSDSPGEPRRTRGPATPAPSCSPTCRRTPGSGFREPGGHRGAGAHLKALRGSLGLRGRRLQVLLAAEGCDPVYTASGHRIWDAEQRKIHRVAVRGHAAEVELPGAQERRPGHQGQAAQVAGLSLGWEGSLGPASPLDGALEGAGHPRSSGAK